MGREQLAGDLQEAGFKTYPSFTNFVLIDCITPHAAQSLDEALRSEGIFLRRQAGAGLPNAIRITVGTEEANTLAVETMIEWKNKQG